MHPEIKLSAAELKSAAAGLAKVIAKNGLPALTCVRCTRETNGAVLLRAGNFDTIVTYQAKEPQAGPPADLLVPFEPFSNTIKRAEAKDRISLARHGKESVLLRSCLGSIVLEELLPSPPLEDWPPAPRLAGEPLTLDWGFRTALREALDCASTDEARPAITGACIDVQDPAAHYLVGSNGQHLYAANSLHLALPRSLIVPNHKFLLWPAFHEDGPWSFRFDLPQSPAEPGWLQLASTHWTVLLQPVEGTYPDWKVLLPAGERSCTQVKLSTQTMAQMQAFIPRLPGESNERLPITVRVQNACLVIGARHEKGGPWTVVPVPEAKVTGRPVEVSLNRKYLLKALRLALDEIEITADDEPVVCRGQGKLLIIQPLIPDGLVTVTPAPTSDSPEPDGEPAANNPPTEDLESEWEEHVSEPVPDNGLPSEGNEEEEAAAPG